MCSACMTISPLGSNSAVEASRRSLMLAECAERIRTAPISSQIACSAPVSTWSSTGSISGRSRWIVPCRSVVADQPVATSSVDSGSSMHRRAGSARGARTSRSPSDGSAPRDRGADPDRDELELLVGVAVAVALLVQRLERLAQLAGLGWRPATGSSNAWPR